MAREGRGALVAAIALVAVLGGAVLGHRALVARRDVAGTSAASAAEGTDAGASDDALLLADHDATVYTDLGEPVLLTALADGRPLVINFWATWCPYCVQELPDYQELFADYGDRVSFAFVDVADGRRECAEDAAVWLADNGYSELPAFYDTSMEATATFGAYSLPTTVVVSADGEVLTITAGMIDPVLMRGALEELLR